MPAKNISDSGFTLIELLISIAIIGILTAIAIPKFNEYRKRGFDARALNDLRNMAIAEEAYFIDNDAYLSCTGPQCTSLPGIGAISRGVQVEMRAQSDSFTGESSHPQGSGRVYQWDSEQGGLLN